MLRYAGAAGSCAAMLALLVQGCDAPSGPAAESPTVEAVTFKTPPFDASNFVAHIDNPYLPLTPGTAFHYRGDTPDGLETNDVIVTRNSKTILGVAVTVLHDKVFLDGELTEDTFDWLAQDRQGNVWYFGEDSKELENGQVVSTEGSWQAGVNGAHPGIIMLAHPKPGVSYVQEDAPDVAEDRAKDLSFKATVSVPYGSFDNCLHTMEWTLLVPGDREHKFYCPDIGVVEEVQPKEGRITSELISITHF